MYDVIIAGGGPSGLSVGAENYQNSAIKLQ